jgi:hypothetical protein
MISINPTGGSKVIKDALEDAVKKYSKKSNQYSHLLPNIITDHHYGEMILFTPKQLKGMKSGNKYYIVCGQGWEGDYTGKIGIAIYEFKGYVRYDDGFLLKGRIYGGNCSASEIYSDDFSVFSTNYYSKYFNSGSGSDPVYLITKFRKGFSPPKSLPDAKLFK